LIAKLCDCRIEEKAEKKVGYPAPHGII
jgi:hypothetical protein